MSNLQFVIQNLINFEFERENLIKFGTRIISGLSRIEKSIQFSFVYYKIFPLQIVCNFFLNSIELVLFLLHLE